jgi:undecaprenyl diphosphate synthase
MSRNLRSSQKKPSGRAKITLPRHVALICDGNRRWARERGLSIEEGHRAGMERVKELARHARKRGISTLTLWGFSTENWKRRLSEVRSIMKIFREAIDDMEQELHNEKVRLIHLGRKDRLPRALMRRIEEVEKATRKYSRFFLNIAVDYGGRDEILRAVRKALKRRIKPEELTEERFGELLDTAGQPFPNPDLIIRTSGELRTSGYLPWQAVYAEWVFAPQYLPAFTVRHFEAALREFSRRERRFGGDGSTSR